MYTAGQYRLLNACQTAYSGSSAIGNSTFRSLTSLDDVLGVRFERELRRVDADDDQALILVLLGPRSDVAERPEPVDARVRAEIREHDLPTQLGGGERRRVEPTGRAVEAGQMALDG